jgi:glutathione S-transferase
MSNVLLYDYPGSICSQMARLALEEKGVIYARQTIDIIKTHEQFEPWYIALNPKSVVPTLRIDDLIVTDTINIVKHVDSDFDGPSLTPKNQQFMEQLMTDIMGLHYGVLLYSGSLTPERTSPTIIARGKLLEQMLIERPEHAALLQKRIDGNRRMQLILGDEDEVDRHITTARSIVSNLNTALGETRFVAGDHYTLADTFATAAIARFRLHGFENWWNGGLKPNVSRYIGAMKDRPSWTAAGIVDS